MAGREARLRNAFCIECDHLEKLAVVFEVLLILLCCVDKQLKHGLATASFVARDGRIPTYRGRECDQRVQLAQLPVAEVECRQGEFFVLECVDRWA